MSLVCGSGPDQTDVRHVNAPVEPVEQATGVPQAEAGPDEGENSNAKPHAKFQSLITHCKPPGLASFNAPVVNTTV